MAQPFFSKSLIATISPVIALAAYFSPFNQHSEWHLWCFWGFLCTFVLPVGITVALGQSPLQWGLSLGDWRFGFLCVVVGLVVMTGLGLWAVNQPDFLAYYFPIAIQHQQAPGRFWLSLFAYMLGWEFFFRGFLLFGLAGQPDHLTLLPIQPKVWLAISFSTLLFGLSHWGKPVLELIGSFLAGVFLCLIAWRTRSCWAPIVLHTLVFGLFTLLVQWRTLGF